VITVAALYIDPRGPYPKMAGVDCWDATRDARLYDGPHPVVAHPPCGPWSAFKHLNRHQTKDCAIRAVEQVRAFGGVLEHPANSALFRALRLPLPGEFPDSAGGYTIKVDQLHWGHVAHKWTWLYFVNVPRGALTPPPFPDRKPTHDLMGARGRNAGAKREGLREASQELRRRTPIAFAEWLVSLARSAAVERAA
jgi:hypothetical protein